MLRKYSFLVPLWVVVLIILLVISLFLLSKLQSSKNQKPAALNRNSSANDSYMTRPSGKDPNSPFWKSWGNQISINQAKEELAFNLKLPSEHNVNLTGKLKVVIAERVPEELAKTQKSRAALLFYSSGVRVMQSFLPRNQVPPTKLSDYKDSASFEQLKRDFKSVNINGVEGIAGAPGAFKNSYGVVERKPGIVTWYKKPLLYTVYGDGYIPLNQLIKIARSFS